VLLRFTGDDRPGIVHEISTTISEFGISISRLGTAVDTSGDTSQFEITTQLVVPVSVDLDAVLDAISRLTDDLGIALHIEDLTDDADDQRDD
jgi:glycine cleavage system regulatory protein